MMLPYISHMLMEDDIDDELIDHLALLQVSQPFAQILSFPSLGTNTNNSEELANSSMRVMVTKAPSIRPYPRAAMWWGHT
jgi:hypothetical protein